jgi:hypothetical protein
VLLNHESKAAFPKLAHFDRSDPRLQLRQKLGVYRTYDYGGPSLRSVTPYRAAMLAARRSRPGGMPESPPIRVTVVIDRSSYGPEELDAITRASEQA